MGTPILVTGGTGTLGSHVVPLLRAAGHDIRVLSRHGRPAADGVEYVTGDLLKDEGVAAAVAGTETVLHLAGGQKGDDVATRNLVRVASHAGVRHLVYISVIGADRVPLAWLRTKLDAERAVADSGIPWTTLRAAQFHDLALTMVEKMTKLPVLPVPGGLRLQPVDVREVAARLAELPPLASRLHGMAVAAGQPVAADHLTRLFGRTTCPDCAEDFSVSEQIERYSLR
ncbi:SDR family oxidoreductase [Streptomyces hokutonensis]|uniref:SDR family oxidoreductase n=1 Tax=Streptomyces hokutonensis TaxID=1306990 RepID=UPI00369BB32C